MSCENTTDIKACLDSICADAAVMDAVIQGASGECVPIEAGLCLPTLATQLLRIPTENAANLAALRLQDHTTISLIWVLGHTNANDGGQGLFCWDATSTDADDDGIVIEETGWVGAGRWVRMRDANHVHVPWFGLSDPETALENAAAALAGTGTPADPYGNRLTLGTYEYTINRVVSMDIPEDTVIDGQAATFDLESDLVMIDLNPDATAAIGGALDTEAKRRVVWKNTKFKCSHGTPTVAGAFKAYAMRSLTFKECYFTGFSNAVEFAGLDSYYFVRCFFFANDISVLVPNGVVTVAADVTIHAFFLWCHFSINTMTHAVKVTDRFLQFHFVGCSWNGATTGAQIHIEPTGALAEAADSEVLTFDSNHAEQFDTAAAPAIYINVDTIDTSRRVRAVNFSRNQFLMPATEYPVGIDADKVQGLVYEQSNEMRAGTAAYVTQIGIKLGADCNRVVLHHRAVMDNVGVPVDYQGTETQRRDNIEMIPNHLILPPDAIYTAVDAESTDPNLSGYIDVSSEWAYYDNYWLPPKAFDISMFFSDDASAAATANSCDLRLAKNASAGNAEMRASSAGLPNDQRVYANGMIELEETVADAGKIYFDHTRIQGQSTAQINVMGAWY